MSKGRDFRGRGVGKQVVENKISKSDPSAGGQIIVNQSPKFDKPKTKKIDKRIGRGV